MVTATAYTDTGHHDPHVTVIVEIHPDDPTQVPRLRELAGELQHDAFLFYDVTMNPDEDVLKVRFSVRRSLSAL
jgi:hypothetical protein